MPRRVTPRHLIERGRDEDHTGMTGDCATPRCHAASHLERIERDEDRANVRVDQLALVPLARRGVLLLLLLLLRSGGDDSYTSRRVRGQILTHQTES